MKYLKLYYKLEFQNKPEWGRAPAFVFRSILGYNLRNVACVLKNQETCIDCMVKDTCVYSVFFETNVDKNLKSLAGRDKAAHPFVIDVLDLDDTGCMLSIVFIGRAVNYIPYINYAMELAGQKGIGKNRVFFKCVEIRTVDGLFSPTISEIQKICQTWPKREYSPIEKPFKIIMETPCRIKSNGKLQSALDLSILINTIHRRMQVLNELFGDDNSLEEADFYVESTPVNQRWKEPRYYSSRQKTLMKLGGVVGEIHIPPIDNQSILAYLDAMELFHVGKNISFGLGRIKVVTDDRSY